MTPQCTDQGNSSYKFDMYDDKIYILDSGWYGASIKVLSKTGQCLQHKTNISYPTWAGYRSTKFSAIAVNENYIFLATGPCYYWCTINHDAAGSITVLRRSDFSFVKRFRTAGRDITSMTFNSDYTKLITTSRNWQYGGVSLWTGSGESYSHTKYLHTGKCYNANCAGGKINTAWDASFDSSGNIYVIDSYGAQIQKFNSSGTYQSKWGWTTSYSGNAYRIPQGMHISSSGKMYVADTYNNKVREVSFSSTSQLHQLFLQQKCQEWILQKRLLKELSLIQNLLVQQTLA